MRYLHLYTFSQQTSLFQEVNALPVTAELVELGQKHRGDYLLLFLSDQALKPSPRVKEAFISKTPAAEHLLAAYFKQKPPLSGEPSLCLLETKSLIALFHELEELPHSSHLIEISRGRGESGDALAVLQGLDAEPVLKNKSIHVAWFAKPNAHLRNFY